MTGASFVDEAVLFVRGGDGGNGVASFQREKYRPKGGPDGGDGGDGGSVILRAEPGVGSLSELARHPHQRAERGRNGSGDSRKGAAGADRILPVPEGTIVRDPETGEILADLSAAHQQVVIARGGRGGRGNQALATANRRAPRFSEGGEPGEERRLLLELRVLADVGLVGLPNAGKSSLIARLSAARPKVAAYPFTTLVPNLGVSSIGDQRFVVADIPGLVEGAAAGRGLGHAFLKHLQRCLVLCYVLDLAEGDPAGTLETLRGELGAYDPSLLDRVTIVAGNKIDIEAAAALIEDARRAADAAAAPFVAVSAVSGEGVEELGARLASAVAEMRAARGAEESRTLIRIRPVDERVEVAREDSAFRVRSARAERLLARFDLGNPDALRYVQERLIGFGVEDALAAAGAKEGDEIRIGDHTFEFVPEAGRSSRRRR